MFRYIAARSLARAQIEKDAIENAERSHDSIFNIEFLLTSLYLSKSLI